MTRPARFFDAATIAKTKSYPKRTAKLSEEQLAGLRQIGSLAQRQRLIWPQIVAKGPGIPKQDAVFQHALDEAYALNREIIRLARNHTLAWVLEDKKAQRTLVLPRKSKTKQPSAGDGTRFPIRDEAHLKIVEVSFLAKASKLPNKKDKDAVSQELNTYVDAEFRLLQYREVIKEVMEQKRHYAAVEKEFGKEFGQQLREHVEKQEGAEAKKKLEALQRKYKQAREHTPSLAKEARRMRLRLEARVAHVEL